MLEVIDNLLAVSQPQEGYAINLQYNNYDMAQSLAKVYIHAVFGTKYRDDSLRRDELLAIHAYMAGVLKGLDCTPVVVGGTTNHVHLLFVIGKKVATADVVEHLKAATTRWMKRQYDCYHSFGWQDGYGAFSVSFSHVWTVKRYIETQEEHHKRESFADEVKRLFVENGLDFCERYW